MGFAWAVPRYGPNEVFDIVFSLYVYLTVNMAHMANIANMTYDVANICLLYTSDAADD